MQNYPTITLKPSKEDSLRYRHPWVFSGAIQDVGLGCGNGSLVKVVSSRGEVMGIGTYSPYSSIAVRMLSFKDVIIDHHWLEHQLRVALEWRRRQGVDTSQEAGFRWVFGEVDSLPGLVIDVYAGVVVIQISTMGIEKLKMELLEAIQHVMEPSTIVERSDLPIRDQEGMSQRKEVVWGELPEKILIKEASLRYQVDVLEGQKTGFFLDQREARKAVAELAPYSRVLNLFSYTGSFGAVCLNRGAHEVINVDSSSKALDQARKNFELNGFRESQYQFINADVFDWITQASVGEFDVVVVDPPALIKSRKDYDAGKKGYRYLAGEAIKFVKPEGYLAFSSCSRYFSPEDMSFVLRQASGRASRPMKLVAQLGQAKDHPVSIYFPESEYLKTMIFQVA